MEENKITDSRRDFLKASAGTGLAALGSVVSAQSFDFKPNQRYPDPSVQILDPSFGKYRIYSSSVEQVGSGMRWAEGPVWFGDGRYLLVSDIPNNRIMRYDEATGTFGVFRHPANFSNGLARDRQGRLLACEHLTRSVTRTDYDGKITVLADKFNGKRLNSPNDIVCKSDGSIWFTDPPFGIGGNWEGDKATPELPHSVYRIAPDGKLGLVTAELGRPQWACVLARREEALCRRRPCAAEPPDLELRRRCQRRGVEQDQGGGCQRPGRDRWHQGRYGWQPVVRLGLERRARRDVVRPGWRDGVQPAGKSYRPHPPARALRKPGLRRRQEKSPVHGELPFAVCAVR